MTSHINIWYSINAIFSPLKLYFRLPSLRLSPVLNSSLLTENSGKNAETDDLNCSNASSNHTNDSNNNSNNSEKIYHNGLSVLSQISDTSDTQV